MLLKFDPHVHTRFSDGTIFYNGLRDLKVLVKNTRINAFAITDHNTVRGVRFARATCKKLGLLFIPGIEISAKEGHIVAYGIEEWSYGAYQLTLDEVLDTCAGLGATVVVAHPLDRRMGIKGRLFEPSVISRIHGYEALNGASPRPNLNLLRSDRSALRSLAVYSGSDCHSPVLFYKFHVEVEASSPRLQDILEAMRKRSRVKPIGPVLDLGHWIADFPPAFSHRRRIKQVEHRGRENK